LRVSERKRDEISSQYQLKNTTWFHFNGTRSVPDTQKTNTRHKEGNL